MINWYLTGPFNPRTLEDFWKVIWQNGTSRIVMLTNTFEGDRVSGRICIVTAWPSLKKYSFFSFLFSFLLLCSFRRKIVLIQVNSNGTFSVALYQLLWKKVSDASQIVLFICYWLTFYSLNIRRLQVFYLHKH